MSLATAVPYSTGLEHFSDLYNCFEVHSREIYAYLDTLCEQNVLTPDVKEFARGSKDILGSLVMLSKMLPSASVRPFVTTLVGDKSFFSGS